MNRRQPGGRALMRWVLGFAIVLLVPAWADDDVAQRYEWSQSYGERTRGGVYREQVELNFFGEEEAFAWYQVQTSADGSEYILVDCHRGEREPAFHHLQLAQQLQARTEKPVDPASLRLGALEFSSDLAHLFFRYDDRVWQWDRQQNELSELDENASAELALSLKTGLSPLQTVARSGSGDATEIEIVNQTDVTLEVFWVTSEGERRSYGRVAPGESFRSGTYVSHAWVLVDPEGRDRAAFQAGRGTNLGYVTADTPSPRPWRRGGGRRGGRRNSPDSQTSPDGRWEVVFRDNNVFLVDTATGDERQYTSDGEREDAYMAPAFWAPNSQHFVALRTQKAEQRRITLVDSSPGDQLQPRLVTIDYTKPGDPLDRPRPYLFHITAKAAPEGTASAASTEASPTAPVLRIDDALFPQPFSLTRMEWSQDSSEFWFVYNQRGHQLLRVLALNAETGNVRSVVEEQSETFVCYSQKFFFQRYEPSGDILWMTERDGWNHLIRIDGRSGEVKNRVTQGAWVVRDVERVDPETETIWLQVSGYHPEEDPYHVHLARVRFDGSDFTLLTSGDGDHRWEYSPEGKWLIDRYSRVDLAPITSLRDARSGALVVELEQADVSELLATGWRPPERFVAKGRDGQTDIHGIIVRPTRFDPQKKYPLLEAIYAGPQASFTPKSFGRHRDLYEMAEMGFIVVKVDGMGTSHRSKAFHDVCWKNLGDSGFPDRILWITAAAKTYPEMDLNRVGIWGGSAGGQSALRALLAYGHFYHAAAADCGCHDNRMDKIWWNEQWMGWPVGPHYEEQSNVTQAHRLVGKLLLTVGELDTNVDPASTLQVVNALIRANKDFELIVFPGAGHGAGSSPYGMRRMKDFFVRALGGPQ